MSALLLEHRLDQVAAPVGARPVERDVRLARTSPRGGLTLDDLITGVWEGLSASRTVRCPACGGAMAPAREHGPQRAGGSCADCGSRLS